MADLNEGDWVRWTWAGDPAYGKVTEVVTEAGTTRSAGGNEFTATEDRPLYVIESWDDDSESWDGRVVKLEGQNGLQTWEGAPSDAPAVDHALTDAQFETGSWVEWDWSGGTAHGKVTEVVTSGSVSVAGGSRNASEDEPAYKLRHWDGDEWGNMAVKSESELSSWSDPPSDTPMMSDGVAAELSQAMFEERVDASDDVFQTREAAQERAAEIGCEGVHPHEHDMGTVYMPCASMDAYEEMADGGVISDPMMEMLSDGGRTLLSDASMVPAEDVVAAVRPSTGTPRAAFHTPTRDTPTDEAVTRALDTVEEMYGARPEVSLTEAGVLVQAHSETGSGLIAHPHELLDITENAIHEQLGGSKSTLLVAGDADGVSMQPCFVLSERLSDEAVATIEQLYAFVTGIEATGYHNDTRFYLDTGETLLSHTALDVAEILVSRMTRGRDTPEIETHEFKVLAGVDDAATDGAMADSDLISSVMMHLGDDEMSVEDIEVDIPESAQSAAQAYVDANDADLIPSSCGTGKGTRIAGDIADNDVSIQQIRQDIAPYLTSHEDDTSTDTHPSDWSMDEDTEDSHWMDCGDAQYAAWGWDSLRDYAQRKANEHARAVGEDEPYADSHVGDAHLPLADATTVMDTITYDGVMTGELDESDIPNDDYQPHYVFDADTKSESSYPLVDGDGNLRRRNVELAFNMRGQTGEGDDEAFLLDVLAEVNDAFDSPPIDEADLMDAMDETDGYHMEEEDGYHMEEKDSYHMEDAVAATDGFRDHVPPAFTVGDTTLADEAVNWDSVPTETLTDAPHRHAFGTDEFYAIDATVAKPMDQEYHIGEETVTFRKTADELRAAAWQLDNVPWTLGHPAANEVTDADQIHGFFRDPEYVDGEGLTATLYVPVGDTKAREMLTDTAAVSIGFTPEIDYDVSDPDIDGVQRDLVIDHVASVQKGRCGVEDGCGIEMLSDDGRTAESDCVSPTLLADADDGTVAVSDCVSCSTGTCSCGWHTEYHDSGDTDMSNEFGLDFTDLSADVIVDNHDGVAEMMANKDEQIADLQAERDDLVDRNETLADALDDRLREDYETARDTLVDHTGRYEADELDERWQAADSVADKREIVTDLSEKVALLNDVADTATDESVSALADSEAQQTNEMTETHNGLRDLRDQTA